MGLELSCGGQTAGLDLAEGRSTVGGGPGDDVQVPGLPHRFLLLLVEGPRVTFTALQPVRVGPALCPARVPRLLLPGEALELPGGATLRRTALPDAPAALGTAHLARELLAGAFSPRAPGAATLTCVAGPDQGLRVPLGSAASVLGRGEAAEVRLQDRAVSRRHAEVAWDGPLPRLRALRSLNGVYLNGRPVEGTPALRTGDVIELGQTLLRFDGPPPPEAPPPAAAPPAPVAAGASPPAATAPEEADGAPAAAEAPPGAALAPPPPDAPPPPLPRASLLERVLVALGAALALGGLGTSAVLLGLTPW